jgi:hypothetical protein
MCDISIIYLTNGGRRLILQRKDASPEQPARSNGGKA